MARRLNVLAVEGPACGMAELPGSASEAAEFQRGLLAAVPDAAFVVSDGAIRLANAAAARLFGARDPAGCVGLDVVDLVAAQSRDAFADWVETARRAHGGLRPTDFRHRSLDGGEFDAEDSGACVTWRGGTATLLIVRDVTAPRLAERDAAETRLLLIDAIESLSDGFALWDSDDRLVLWNSRLAQTFRDRRHLFVNGTPFAKFAEDRVDDVYPALGAKEKAALVAERITAHRELTGAGEFEMRPGRWYMITERVTGAGSIVSIYTDISQIKESQQEKRRLEEELRRAHKMESLGTLAGGIAHEFNNLLQPIMGLAELAAADVSVGSPSLRHLSRIVDNAERAANLVGRILAFSRAEDSSKEPMDLCEIVNDAIGLLEITLPATIAVRKRLDETVGAFAVDKAQIHQVLMNLAANAVHAIDAAVGEIGFELATETCPLDRPVTSGTLRAGRYARISVRDTGSGMDEATLARIFEPFFTTKAVGEGTGMGLAVVHGIVVNHGGVIEVATTPGAGTAFHIYLPSRADGVAAVQPVAVTEAS